MSKTNPGQSTAVRVAAAATGGSVLVHSVPSRKELYAVQVSNLSEGKSMYKCSACATNIVASSHAAPACVSCGSATKKTQASVKPESGPVVAVECRHCAAVHLMEANVVRASGYHLHCSACGEANDYKKQASKIESALAKSVTAEAEEDLDLDPADLEADLAPDGTEEVASGEWPFDEDEPATAVKASEWPLDDEEPSEESVTAGAEDDEELTFEDSGEELEAGVDEEDDEDLPLELDDLDESVSADADELPMNEVPEELVSEEPVDYEAPDLDTGDSLADALSIDDTDAGLSLQATAGRVVAMKGHIAVASLKAENAGANRNIITTAGFQSAVLHLAKKDGMRKALASVGFQPIRIQTLTAAAVSRKVHEAQQSTVNSSAEKTASFTESIALAAAGLSRGAWKGKTNPLQAALIEELRTIGVKNPERIVARVLSAHMVPTTKVLVELASELNSMSSNARKETASILGMTEIVAEASAEEEDDEDVEDTTASANDFNGRLRSTAAVLPSVLSPSLSMSSRDASRKSVQAKATANALGILDGSTPLMLG